jgi:hypothetical protein
MFSSTIIDFEVELPEIQVQINEHGNDFGCELVAIGVRGVWKPRWAILCS